MNRLIELTLHLELRIAAAKRLGIQRVRLDMIDRYTAELMLEVLRRAIR